jgi:hypothetical protein
MSQTSKVIKQIRTTANMYSYIQLVENEDIRRRHLNKRAPVAAKQNHSPIRKRRQDPRIDALVDTIDLENIA